MNKKHTTLLGLALVLGGAGLVGLIGTSAPPDGTYDAFAQCLADKKITMYGAEWCPHCQNEKRRFGTSFRFVPYVECPDDPRACIAAGVEGYPTWIFPDGRKRAGEQGLQKLSEESGCALPEKVGT